MVETIQEIVRHELQGLRITELGIVEAVFPHASAGDDDNYGCDVRLKNSGLLLRRVPVITGHIGTAAIPNVGDLVLLAFHLGDVNQPVIIGRLYNDEDRPPQNTTDEVVFRLPLAEPDARSITAAIRNHQSESPPREMVAELPPKITLRVTDGTVTATAGRTEMALEQPDGAGGKVTVFAGRTKITMNQDGDLVVEAAGSISLKADGDVSIEGQNVNVSSMLATKIDAGTQAEISASMGATVSGGLSSTVSGATVSVKGITSFSPG
ncbi:MAG TPA: phage baseplate assembly protein V [Actinomycetota bacterium]|nr:phage baseplate assembly protein V [Actinomycetota bacterium]